MSLKFKDGTAYENVLGNAPSKITVIIDNYSDLQRLETELLSDGNLDSITLNDTEYTNLTVSQELCFTTVRKDEKIHVIFSLRQKTAAEIALEQEQKVMEKQQNVVNVALTYLTDQQALTVKDIFRKWDDDPDGYHYSLGNPADQRRQYDDGLWKLLKNHDKQSSWYPGADPTLWIQIVEGHAGTFEDPIPVPDSVTTSGFEYVYGNYYSEGSTIYLCQRQGVPNPEEMYGQTEKLYFPPSALAGQYFILAEETDETI